MQTHWRQLRRWFSDRRPRLLDLLVLLIFSAGVGVWLQHGGRGLPLLHPALGQPAYALPLWLGATLAGLIIYAARRWVEIDGLLQDAQTDALTGIANRRRIEEVLAREFDRALRYDRPLSILMIDIDHFKRVNDRFGHAIGDQVLMSVVRRVRRRLRLSDHFGRWGGEEFILICPETDTPDAMLVADRLRRTIRQKPMRKAGLVTASIGVATYAGQGDYSRLIKDADAFLYVAKRQGRDRVISRFVLMAQERMRQEGIPIDEGNCDDEPASEDPGILDRLSTLMTTIMELPRQSRRPRG